MIEPRLPTYFLSHGGGPWPWLKAERGSMYDRLEASLLDVRRELGLRTGTFPQNLGGQGKVGGSHLSLDTLF